MNELISLTDITKVYRETGGRRSQASLNIPTGQFAAVMGPSGSPSHPPAAVAGRPPSTGCGQVDGVNVNKQRGGAGALSPREIGFVFSSLTCWIGLPSSTTFCCQRSWSA